MRAKWQPFIFSPKSIAWCGKAVRGRRDASAGRKVLMTDAASLVPLYENNDVYLVLDELVTFGRVWCELSEKSANEQTVLELIANGGFNHPIRVIVFNTAEGWSRDHTIALGLKLLQMSHEGRVLGAAAHEFVKRTTGQVPASKFHKSVAR
jgi:hypothetical protein